MNKAETLKTIRNLTPDKVLFSPRGRLRIALLQLAARLLPGRFAVWLSLLDEAQLERQVRIKFGPRSLVPGSGAYDVPRLHLIVERGDWLTLALNDDVLSPTGSFFDVDVPRLVLDRILTGELDLSSALLRGRIRVGGDTGLAAQLVNAVNPPPAYPPGQPTPNIYVGLSDHPLDRQAINFDNVFDLFGAPPRTAACVQRVDLRERRGNSFVFRARGYDVYHKGLPAHRPLGRRLDRPDRERPLLARLSS